MEAFLNYLEKILIWFFSLAFGVVLVYGVVRYNHRQTHESDPWVAAQKQHTIEGYLNFLRQCRACPMQAKARAALDELQRPAGLIARLSAGHLPDRSSITRAVFSPDAEVVLALGGQGPDFWESMTGQRSSFGEKTFSGGARAAAVDYAPDGHRVGVGVPGAKGGGRLLVWDLTSESLIATHEVEASEVRSVMFSPDGRWLGWQGDGPLGMWDPVGGVFLRMTHEGATSMAFRSAGDHQSVFLSAGRRELWVWDPSTMERLKEHYMDSDFPLLGLSRDGRVIAFTDGSVLDLWDTESVKPIGSLRDLKGRIVSFCRETATGRIVIGSDTGMIYVWNPVGSSLPAGQVAAHQGPVEALACGGMGRVVSSGWDGAKVWDLAIVTQGASSERPSGALR